MRIFGFFTGLSYGIADGWAMRISWKTEQMFLCSSGHRSLHGGLVMEVVGALPQMRFCAVCDAAL